MPTPSTPAYDGSATEFGHGDEFASYGHGGYGDHAYGFGHPFHIITLFTSATVHDLGGMPVTFDASAAGALPPGPYTVKVGGVECYSGVSGQGNVVYPSVDSTTKETKGTFDVIIPNLMGTATFPSSATVEISFPPTAAWPTGKITVPDAIRILKHPGRTSTTVLALRFPREVYSIPIYTSRVD